MPQLITARSARGLFTPSIAATASPCRHIVRSLSTTTPHQRHSQNIHLSGCWPPRSSRLHQKHNYIFSSSPSYFSFATIQSSKAYSSEAMSPIPSNMKAVQIAKNGGVEVLKHKEIPVPSLPSNHVLVKNHYAGVNFIDTYFRTGLYPTASFPLTLGREAAGEVVAAHESVSGFAPGTRVVYMVGPESGAYAEYTAVDASKAVAIPDDLTTEMAASVMLQGLTAWTFVREAGNVQPGQWALVHAASGGVGTLLVQMLRSIGAKIIATASTDEKMALARKNGAEWTINSHDDLVTKVKEITGGHGVDVIFDGVGKATFDADLQMIALKGHLISFGNASGAVPPVNILQLGAKNVKLMRPVVNGYVAERKDLEKYTSELFELVTSKKLEIVIHKVYPLSEAAQAHSDIEGRGTTGKLLLKCT